MATAWRPAARSSRNGWSCYLLRAHSKSRSHASLPIPMTHDRLASAARNPTARTSRREVARTESALSRADLAPGLMVATRKSARAR